MLCGRLQRRPTAKEGASCELLPCGVIIITDAMTIAADPAVLKRVRESPPPPPPPRAPLALHVSALKPKGTCLPL